MAALAAIARKLGARVKNVAGGGSRFIRNAPARIWNMLQLGFGGVVGTMVALAVLTFAAKTLL